MDNIMVINYKANNLATKNIFYTKIIIILIRKENNLVIHDSYLDFDFKLPAKTCADYGDPSNTRLVSSGMIALLRSVKAKTGAGRTIECINSFHPNLLMYKFLSSTVDEYESDFVRNHCV